MQRAHSRTFEAELADRAARIQATLGAEFWNRIQYFRSKADADRHLREITRDFLRLFVSSNVSNMKAPQAQADSNRGVRANLGRRPPGRRAVAVALASRPPQASRTSDAMFPVLMVRAFSWI